MSSNSSIQISAPLMTLRWNRANLPGTEMIFAFRQRGRWHCPHHHITPLLDRIFVVSVLRFPPQETLVRKRLGIRRWNIPSRCIYVWKCHISTNPYARKMSKLERIHSFDVILTQRRYSSLFLNYKNELIFQEVIRSTNNATTLRGSMWGTSLSLLLYRISFSSVE